MSNHYNPRSYNNAIAKKAAVFLFVILSAFNLGAATLQNEDCGAPIFVTVNTIGTSHITFNWTPPASVPENGYYWEIRTAGDPGSGTEGFVQSGSTTAPEAVALNLTPGTTYTLSVRSSCATGVYSEWSIVSFFTRSTLSNEAGQIGQGIEVSLSLYGPILYIGATPRKGSVSNMLFTAEELADMGIPENAFITGIGFNKTTNATSVGYTPSRMRVLLANSTTISPLSLTTTLADVEATHTEVMDNDAFVLDATIGWIDFNFEQSFQYTGENLEIATAMYHNLANTDNNNYFSGLVSWQYTSGYKDYMIGAWPLPTVDINNPAAVVLSHNSGGGQFKDRPNIRIYYQVSGAVDAVTINSATAASEITENQGTLQLAATVSPSTASQDVSWEILSGAEFASIDHNGLITAFANGTLVIRAVAMDDNTKFSEIAITITNQAPCNVAFPAQTEPITLVQFSGINNPSSALSGGTTPAYEDFTAIAGEVTKGQSYTLTVKGNTSGNFSHHINAYIDWNRNNSFEDEGEAYIVGNIQNSTGLDNTAATLSITIPVTAAIGNTRMRVIKKFNVDALPCNSLGYGQAEDYTLSVNDINMGIGNPETATIAVYPNPFTDSIQLHTTEAIAKMEVFNYLGQSVAKTGTNEINLSSLSSGIYIIRVDFENGKSATAKVIKK